MTGTKQKKTISEDWDRPPLMAGKKRGKGIKFSAKTQTLINSFLAA